MTKRQRKKASVLKGQRPKKNAKIDWIPLLRRGVKVLSTALVVGLLAFGLVRARDLVFGPSKAAPGGRPAWKVALKTTDDRALPDKFADAAIAVARKEIQDGEREDMERVARKIQALGPYASVHVSRLGLDQILVQLRPRVAALCVQADRLRFVSEDGEVYGSPDVGMDPDDNGCPGPTLSGVFRDARFPSLKEDATLPLEPEQRVALQEAVELARLLKAKGQAVDTLEWRPFRGLFLKLTATDTDVALGRAPFGQKVDKLAEILEKLAVKGQQAARIELDYQGKAFVKLRKG
jgi:hypothetical protein